MSELAGHLVEFGGDLHTHDGWIARRLSDGTTDREGFRYARQAPCAACDNPAVGCAEADCVGWYWQYVGRAFASEDAATALAEIVALFEIVAGGDSR